MTISHILLYIRIFMYSHNISKSYSFIIRERFSYDKKELTILWKKGLVVVKFYRKILKKKIKPLGLLVFFIIIPLIISTPLFKFNNNDSQENDDKNEQNFAPKLSAPPPNENYFRYYKVITIDPTKVSGTGSHVNFPVLISLFDSDLRIDVQSNGNDIAFSNDTDWLYHEIEEFNQTYNNTHAQLVAWVRIPSLSTSVDTTIYMYYGNYTMGAREIPTGVWDANYIGVWHLSEVSGGSLAIKDSTLNANDGTDQGSVELGATGQIGGAIRMDEYQDYINIPDSSSLDRPSSDITISAWTNADYFSGTFLF
ncbi:hypothetical protein LCGC14_1288850 [marine sediment metagenome]|uniref:DUF2341 domain-containing protein n=1 Tax=marine sediment metagenome TaxID=412755 RepID=A0A0F9KUP9_9ZZZZ